MQQRFLPKALHLGPYLFSKKKGFYQPEIGEILIQNFTYCSYVTVIDKGVGK